jgi:hypothetical protein
MIIMNVVMNKTSDIQLFQMLRTNADEVKTGRVNPGEYATMSAAFDRNPKADQGGGAAQDSPSYNKYMHYGETDPTSVFDWNRGTVFAAGQESAKSIATCDDGPYPAGRVNCPETSADAQSATVHVADSISVVAKSPLNGGWLVNSVAQAWVKSVGAAVDAIFAQTFGRFIEFAHNLINNMTHDELAKLEDEIHKWFADKLMKSGAFVNPFSDNMSGARVFELATCGADWAGNDVARYVQGGRVLRPSELAAIRKSQLAQRRAEFASRPLYARMFDNQDSMSLVSRIANDSPNSSGSPGTLITSVANGLVRTASSGLASTILPEKTFAAVRDGPDPCGVTQYGWPQDERVFTEDPEKAWVDYDCANPDQVRNWGEQATTINPVTKMNEQLQTNPCLLIKNAISGAGGRFDSDLLQTFGVAAASNSAGGTGDGQWHWPPDGEFHAGPCWNVRTSFGYHAGMDMNAAKANTKALAAHDGVVEKLDLAGNGPGGVWAIIKVSGTDNLYYAYEHMVSGSVQVKEGQSVVGGKTVIGAIGKTGRIRASAPGHLHMVVAKTATLGSYSSSPQKNTLDPMDYLPKPAPYGYKCTK